MANLSQLFHVCIKCTLGKTEINKIILLFLKPANPSMPTCNKGSTCINSFALSTDPK